MSAAGEQVRVVFVCLGNICRSPTAEAVFRRDVIAAGLERRFEIDSAGTGSWHTGELAHADTRRTASGRGVTITHRARLFTKKDFDRFDHVLVMDRANLENVRAIATSDEARAKVHLFRSFESDAPEEAEVPDPYYSGQFELVFDICERASAALLAHLRRAHGL
jgi:protein-tyrosine phosphatase